MADVFISYSRKDKDFVQRLVEVLRSRQRDTWIDWEDIPLSADWWHEICAGIEAANTFVFIISPNSLASPVCNLEVAHAHSQNKRLVPIMHSKVDEKTAFATLATLQLDENIETTLNGRDILAVARDNWRTLSRHNWLFFEDDRAFDQNFEKLLEIIETDLDYVHAHTRLLMRAREWEQNAGNPSYLLQGDDLKNAETWLASSGSKEPSAAALHTSYIVASREAENRRQQETIRLQRRAVNVLRYLAVVITIALVLAVGLSLFAFDQRNQALTSAARSESLRLAAEGNGILSAGGNAEIAAMFGVLALNTTYSPQADSLSLRAIPLVYTEQVIREHDATLVAVDFSSDGSRFLTASYFGDIVVHNTETGEVIRRLALESIGDPIPLLEAMFSPDGNFVLAYFYYIPEAILWDIQTGEQVGWFSSPNYLENWDNLSFDFSPDSTHFLMSQYGVVSLWDIWNASSTALQTYMGYSNATFAADGRTFAMVSEEGIEIYSFETLETLRHLPMVDPEQISHLMFSPDGTRLLVDTALDSLIIDSDSGEELARIETNGGKTLFSPDGQFLLVSEFERQYVELWDLETLSVVRRFDGHTSPIADIAFSPDGLILTASYDNSVRLWNSRLDNDPHYLNAQTTEVSAVALSPDGTRLVTGGEDGIVRLWDAETGNEVSRLSGHEARINSLSFSANGEKLLSVSNYFLEGGDYFALLWDSETGEELSRVEGRVGALSPDGRYIVTNNAGESFLGIHRWDAVTGELLNESEPLYYAITINYSADGDRILVGTQDGIAVLYDAESLEILQRFSGHVGAVHGVAFSPDGRYVLTGSGDNTLRLWDIETGIEIQRYGGQRNNFFAVAFSPDGSQVVGVGGDDTVRIYDAVSGVQVREMTLHTNGIWAVAYAPDGEHILTGGGDGIARYTEVDYRAWEAYACSRLPRNFSDSERQQYTLQEAVSLCPSS